MKYLNSLVQQQSLQPSGKWHHVIWHLPTYQATWCHFSEGCSLQSSSWEWEVSFKQIWITNTPCIMYYTYKHTYSMYIQTHIQHVHTNPHTACTFTHTYSMYIQTHIQHVHTHTHTACTYTHTHSMYIQTHIQHVHTNPHTACIYTHTHTACTYTHTYSMYKQTHI